MTPQTQGNRIARRLRSDGARLAGVLTSAFLLASSFPPWAAGESAWVALVPLLIVARFTAPARAAAWGFACGFLFWLATLAWLLRLHDTGAVPWPVIGGGWVLLSAYCAAYVAAFSFMASFALRFLCRPGSPVTDAAADAGRVARLRTELARAGRHGSALLALPLLWVGTEYIRSNIFTGYPWNTLGVSQYANLSVIQVAEWGGVYAVSAVLVVMNSAIALTVLRFVAAARREYFTRFHVEMTAGLLLCAACWIIGMKRAHWAAQSPAEAEPVRVAAVQPNFPQNEKWTVESVVAVYDRLRKLTDLASRAAPDLVVWPETAVPSPVNTDESARAFLGGLPLDGSHLLAGALEDAGTVDVPRFHNSSLLVSPDGKILASYRKRHLVLFGEYLPLEHTFPSLSRWSPLGWTCEPGRSNTVFHIPAGRAAARGPGGSGRVSLCALICFEDIFPHLSRQAVRDGARLLINQSNDAWFDGTPGPLQHMAHCVFRAVENRVPVVRSTNTGVTCAIRRSGRVVLLEMDGQSSGFAGFHPFVVPVQGEAMEQTFYTRHGDRWFAAPAAMLCLGVFALAVWRTRRENHALRQDGDRAVGG